MTEFREALAVQWPGAVGFGGNYACVGQMLAMPNPMNHGVYRDVGLVTRITVTCDIPALHCDLERVRVYIGDQIAIESPLYAVETIQYFVQQPASPEEA